MKTKKTRSPLARAAPLRAAGQSLSEEFDDVAYDHILAPMFLAVFMALIAFLEWIKYANDSKPNPILYTVFAVLVAIYAALKVWRTRKRLGQIRLRRDGERVVAQYLEWFRTSQFLCFSRCAKW